MVKSKEEQEEEAEEMAAVEEKAKAKGKGKGKGKRSAVKESDESTEDLTKAKKRKPTDCDEDSSSSSELVRPPLFKPRKQAPKKKTTEPVAATSATKVLRYYGLSDSSDVQDCEKMHCEEPTSDDDASSPDNAGASSPEQMPGPESEMTLTLTCVSLPQDKQLVAIDYMKKHRFMWDKRDKDYRTKLRYGHWFILGAKFGCTRDEMMKWYQTFRLRYFKIKVKRSMHMQTGDAPPHLTPKQQFIWDNGKFLDHDLQQ